MIARVLRQAAARLIAVTEVPQLEAEILLAHTLNVSRSYLLARSNELLSSEIDIQFTETVTRRLQGEPIAYLTGHREFWSLDLAVTNAVLIPRPETELLIELILKKFSRPLMAMDAKCKFRLADLGTGSGAIALAIASERPEWAIDATDLSIAALTVAKQNAKRLNMQNITFLLGAWCAPLSGQFDVIVSNPPYLAEDDIHLNQGDLRYEPKAALVSGVDGLNAIREIIISAKAYLKPGGDLFLEHGYQQGSEVRELLAHAGYVNVMTHVDLAGLERATAGILPAMV